MQQIAISDRLRHAANVLHLMDQHVTAEWVREGRKKLEALVQSTAEQLASFNDLWMAYSNLRADHEALKQMLAESNIIIKD